MVAQSIRSLFVRSALALSAILLALVPLTTTSAQSQFSQSGFTEDVVLSLAFQGAAFAFTPTSTPGNERVYIADKRGKIWVAVNGSLQPQPFLDLTGSVNTSTDRGLIAIAVDPDFPATPYVYFGYTLNSNPNGAPTSDGGPRVVQVVRVLADAAKDYNVAAGPLEVVIGKNSTVQNIAPLPESQPSGSTVDPLYPPAFRASCMSGLTMLKDGAGNGEPIDDCIAADGKSHTAGTLIFGPDKSLYASFGDGTDYDNAWPAGLRALRIDTLNGKVLRVNKDTGAGLASNPFFDSSNPNANRSKVWALGLRNPFRMTINPANGEAYFCDVGTSYWEEINSGKGGNFGWPCYEGALTTVGSQCQNGSRTREPAFGAGTYNRKNSRYQNGAYTKQLCEAFYTANGTTPPPQPPLFVSPPMFTYEHPYDCSVSPAKDIGASATGAAFYPSNANAYPSEFKGSLFFSDYAERRIRYLTFDSSGAPTMHAFSEELSASRAGPIQLLIGPDTNLYALTLDLTTKSSQIRRIRYAGSTAPPSVIVKASPDAGSRPLPVQFSSEGTIDPNGRPLSFSWNFGDGATSTLPSPSHTYTAVGTFIATLTVTETVAPFLSATASVTIRTGVTPPQAFIDAPADKATYQVGETVAFAGHAAFSQQSNNPDVTLTWSIILKHNDHDHLAQEVEGPTGSFVVEDHGDNTRYLLCLFADGGGGLQDQKCIDLFPKRTTTTILSNPVGAPIEITSGDDEQLIVAPADLPLIVGSQHTITAPATFAGRGFAGWSDGVTTPQRSVTVGTTPISLKADYLNAPPKAAIISSATAGIAPVTLTFDGRISSDPEGSPLGYFWELGDGVTSDDAVVERSFTSPGVYPVTLTVTDRGGSSSTTAVSVRIDSAPTPVPERTTIPDPTPTPGTAVVTPAPTPLLLATPTPRPLTKPRVKLSVVRGRACGGHSNPCRVRRTTRVNLELTSSETLPNTYTSVIVVPVARREARETVVASRVITVKPSRTTVRLPVGRLKRGVLYKVTVQIAAEGAVPARSSFRYIRVS